MVDGGVQAMARTGDHADTFAVAPDDVLGKFFSEFLDESSFAEFRKAERLIASLKRQDLTVSGYPTVRPHHCASVLTYLESLFELSAGRLRVESAVVHRFVDMLSDFAEFCDKIYPNEAAAVQILKARLLLFVDNPQDALRLVEHYFHRPYAVAGSFSLIFKIVEVHTQASLRMGSSPDASISFLAFSRWLAAHSPGTFLLNWPVLLRYIAVTPLPAGNNLLDRAIRGGARRYLREINGRGAVVGFVQAWLHKHMLRWLLLLFVFLTQFGHKHGSPYTRQRETKRITLVTRAMGGIGDMLMMEPGLEALAQMQGSKVDFAIPRKFHAIFRHNPHINLIDIDGPPIDISRYRRWVNLSDCPASKYENRARPNVRRGRVELFAAAMGVRPRHLKRQGWQVRMFLSDDDKAFCANYVLEHGLGKRPIIGIQPYSRDSYKDHPGIHAIIAAIARQYDIIIFHHVPDGLPQFEGSHSTAGLSLDKSLALVSVLDAMVAVDSAFLHAASAFDIPLIGLFGPTDGRPLTRHHRYRQIVWKTNQFACVPCWRNEDLPCAITNSVSISPCVAAITAQDVLTAVEQELADQAARA